MVADGEFLEHATVFGDHYYGTAVSALEQARERGNDLLLDIDVQGALQVMQKMPEAVSIFILPPTPEVLERRLRNRSQAEGVADEAEIKNRLSQARKELEQLAEYKYALVNDVLDEAASEMRAIVLQARGNASAKDAALAKSCETVAKSEHLESALASFDVGA
jgi:guanylate kinase